MSKKDNIPSDEQTLAQDYEQRLSFHWSNSSRYIPLVRAGNITPSNGERYGCPLCSYWALKERTVRSHITYCKDDSHADEDGFLDNIEVQVFDNLGVQIAIVASPQSKRMGEDIDGSYLPEGVSDGSKAAEVLKLAIYDPDLSEKNITQKVNGVPNEDPSYTQGILESYLVDGTETNVDILETVPEFGELSEAKQKLVDAYIKDSDRPLAEIEREADAPRRYGRLILGNCRKVIEPRRKAVQDGAELVLEQDNDEEHSPEEVEKKGWEDLSNSQQEIIEMFVLNLDMGRKEVDAEFGFSIGHTSRTLDKYEYLLDRLQLTVDTNEEAEHEAPETQPWSDGNESDQSQVKLNQSEWLEIIRSLSKTDADDELLLKTVEHAF